MTTSSPVDIVRINARLNVGGIARHVAWLTGGLAKRGFSTLLVAGTVPDGEADMREFVAAQGADPLILPEMSREISVRDGAAVWKVYWLLRRLRPKIVHTHAAKAGAVGRVAAWLYRWGTLGTLIGRPRQCRVVHTYHGHIFHSYYGRWKTWFFLTIERLLARLATDRIVTISASQREEIHGRFRVGRADQFAVIPLGIDLEAYADWKKKQFILRSQLGLAASTVLVGIVGRLTEIKNHKLFLEAVAAYRSRYALESRSKVRFLVIGDGHLRQSLVEETKRLGLGDCVSFLGMRSDPEVFYPALDVVALTSDNEGTPLSVIEGFANARVAVATNVGGVADLLGKPESDGENDGYRICERGISVRPGDAEAVAGALDRAIEDRALRQKLGERGLEFVQANYSKERLLQDVAALYDELLDSDRTVSHPLKFTRSEPCGC